MLYFIPDWEDRLDPNYNFEQDIFSRQRESAYETDVYAHEIYKKPPYDGLLVSLAVFKDKFRLSLDTNGREHLRSHYSIRNYLRIKGNSSLKVIGDCGAFTYINEEVPPSDYETIKVAKLYHALGFDYGVSVDHMIPDFIIKKFKNGKSKKVLLSNEKKESRRQLSLKNARKFIKYHEKNKFKYVPIGVVQGYSPATYVDSARKVIKMGYSYIGIGTLVPKSDEQIIEILMAVKAEIGQKKINIHLFGILRPQILKAIKEVGVTSFDSASYLRKAWLRAGQNYMLPDENWYAAVRVPYATNNRLLKNAAKDGLSDADVKKMEQRCLRLLSDFADNKIKDIDKVLMPILEYDMLLLRDYDGNHHHDKYKRTLTERPWEKCDCEMCKEIGVHVIIFRGANRNKRRGFHNTKMFYEYLQRI